MEASETGELQCQGQVAVISGGLGDIGRATALALREAGATVAICDLASSARAQHVLPGFHYTRVNVTDPRAIKAWLREVEKKLGVPTLIICNAATVQLDTPMTVTVTNWRKTMAINTDGAYFLAQIAAQRMIEKKRPGKIVFVGSWAGHAPHRHVTAYSVAKAALRMAMECLAIELAPTGIRVNEIAPGKVDAGLSGKYYRENPRLRSKARKRVPIGQLLRSDDVAQGILYLCDPANRHMTGSVLLMDGGLSLVRPR